MPLKIENIKFDKEKYIYGDDKEMKVSFDLVSDDKEYKLNSVTLNYGVIVYINGEENDDSIDSILIKEDTIITPNKTESISIIIPIKYPNYVGYLLELKNYFKILADKKLNIFDFETEKYYPKIILKLDNFDNLNLDEEINKVIIITDLDNYNKISEEKKSLIDIFINGELTEDEFDSELSLLENKQKSFFKITDEEKYKELLKIQEEENIFDNYGTIDDIENEENYIELHNGDHISKDFFKYLYSKYFILKLFYGPLSISIKIFVVLGFIYFFYFLEKNNLSNSSNSIQVYISFSLLVIIFLLIAYFGIKKVFIKKVSNDIVKINFKNKIEIEEKFKSNNLKFDDVIKDCFINYDGDYKCEFIVTLDCIFKTYRYEGSGKSQRKVEYKEAVFTYKLGEYTGNSLNINNVKKNILTYDILKNNIPKGSINSKNISKIEYGINYTFKSNELINSSGALLLD